MAAPVGQSGEDAGSGFDWPEWLRRWDEQQTGFLPEREARFTAMLDLVAALLPADFVAVDLASGPGSLAQRLLARFPAARCVAVDLDPMLVALGRGALGDAGGRLHWVEADVGADNLVRALGRPQVDAVLSTTALHWLPPDRLAATYRRLAGLLRPGGVLLNGDNIPYDGGGALQRIAESVRERNATAAFGADPASGWFGWWQAAAAEPTLTALVAERERRFSDRPRDHAEPPIGFHLQALRAAGFAEVDVAWQQHDDRVVVAVR